MKIDRHAVLLYTCQARKSVSATFTVDNGRPANVKRTIFLDAKKRGKHTGRSMQLVQHVPRQRIPWSRYEASSIRLPTLLDSSNSRDQGVIRSTAVQWTDYYRGWNKRSRYSPAPITLLYLPCYLTGNACNEGKDRIYIPRGGIMWWKSLQAVYRFPWNCL